MKKFFTLFFYFSTSLAFSQTTWFADDFDRPFESYWYAASGEWTSGDSIVQIRTENEGRLLAARYYVFDTAPYAIEVRLRGERAGVYFSLDDTTTNALSHIVRFDGTSVLCGYVTGAGEYTTTCSFAVTPTSDWRVLRIGVDPGQRKYTVFVDGDSLGVADLTFPSGYVGLQASAGDAEFDEIRIVGEQKPFPPKPPTIGEPVRFNHVRYVRSLGRNVLIYNRELGLLQTLSPDGKLVHQEPAEGAASGSEGVFHNGKMYTLTEEAIVVSDLTTAATDSIAEPLIAPCRMLVDEQGMLYVADVGAGAVIKFDAENNYVTSFSAEAIGGLLAPMGLSFHREDDIVIADYDRLVFVNKFLEELQPEVSFPAPSRAVISWRETVLDTPFVSFRPEDGEWRRRLGDIDFIAHRYRVMLDNLTPLQPYTFRVSPTLKTIPKRRGWSKDFRFMTPPAESMSR